MTREEALKIAAVTHGWLRTDMEKEALETLIPELKESEDERIIKTLQEYVKNRNWPLNGLTQDEVLAWLEKQKERKPEEKPINWTELTWKDIVELEGIINNVHYEFRNGIGQESFGKEVLEKFREYKGDEYLDEIEQKPAEWSKEDENKIERLAFLVSVAEEKEMISSSESIDLRKFVKSYHPQSKQEWSEKDKEWLSEVYFAIDHSMYSEDERQAMKNYIDSLRSQAKLKQERNEEDEKVRRWLLEYFYLHKEDLRGASVTPMEILSFLDRYGIEEYRNEVEFNPKPGDKFLVRCKTEKKDNLWFDKGDERPAYVVDADGIITYIVYINKDGKGNCVSYQNKEKFLETFEIIKKPE